MKKYLISLFTLVIVLLNIESLTAQEEKTKGSFEFRKFGLGLNLEENITESYYYWFNPPVRLTFSANIKNRIRIEPEAGFTYTRHYDDHTEREEKNKTLAVGVGAYGLTPKGSICMVYGCKLSYIRYKHNIYNSYEEESSANGVCFGPVVGLDYLISPQFTIGVDFELLYEYQITKDIDYINVDFVKESSNTYLETIAGLKLRFYF